MTWLQKEAFNIDLCHFPMKKYCLKIIRDFSFRMAILTPLFFVFRNYKEISGKVTGALLVNILVSSLFVIIRKTPGICDVLPTTEVRLYEQTKNNFNQGKGCVIDLYKL